jgi:sugar O-acyltransferase (sialic acid O-acetyltransferase NeuD family)
MKTIIYGAGATARMAAALLGDQVGGVVADYASSYGSSQLGQHSIYEAARLQTLFPPHRFSLLICIGYQHGGMNAKREQLYELYKAAGYGFDVVLPPYPPKVIGEGCMLLPGVVVHDNVQIGVNCFVSSNTVIGHDVQVGAHSWINANVSIDGGAVVGEKCVIGAGAVIGAGVKLGARTLVGPGAVVLRDTEPGGVYLAPVAKRHRFSSNVFGRIG